MDLDSIIKFIQGVGFPIFVAVYLLVVFESTIRENTRVLRDLTKFLEGKSTNGGNVHG